MRLYLAGADAHKMYLHFPSEYPLLISYWYIKTAKGQSLVDYAFNQQTPIFLDSGAFSAMTLGAEINIDEYIEYCQGEKHKFDVIASLDVIGNGEATYRNHTHMKANGVDSIPTFHVNTPFRLLDRMVRENDYIALGVAGNQAKVNKVMSWLIHCWKIVKSTNNKCRLHGFGLTSSLIMQSFPWTSVDSTRWSVGTRWGRVIVDNKKQLIDMRPDHPLYSKFSYKIGHFYEDAPKGRWIDETKYQDLLLYNASVLQDWVIRLNGQANRPPG